MDNSEVIFDLINFNIEGVDVYHHNGSLWLIFTDDKKWVIELTKDGTLWYNYYFFTNCFKYLSLDVVNNQHYITKWVENVIQNGVINTKTFKRMHARLVENVIQNGVINTHYHWDLESTIVENVIQNGVINTGMPMGALVASVENVIQNGVINTSFPLSHSHSHVENVIQNGVINTIAHGLISANTVENVIQNGVTNTMSARLVAAKMVENVIQNGVTNTKCGSINDEQRAENVIQNGIRNTIRQDITQLSEVEDVIQNGVKEVTAGKTERLTMINETIQNGVKEIKTNDSYRNYFKQNNKTEKVIENGVKIIKPAFKYVCNPINFEIIKQEETRYCTVKDVVDFGVKKTLPDNLFDTSVVEYNIENGINEVIPLPAQDGNRDWGVYYQRQGDVLKPHVKYVDDAINLGIKKTI